MYERIILCLMLWLIRMLPQGHVKTDLSLRMYQAIMTELGRDVS